MTNKGVIERDPDVTIQDRLRVTRLALMNACDVITKFVQEMPINTYEFPDDVQRYIKALGVLEDAGKALRA